MLYKKEIADYPLLPIPHGEIKNALGKTHIAAAEVAKLPRSGKVLIVDIYNLTNNNLAVRFVSDGKNYQTVREYPVRIWTKQNPRSIMGTYNTVSEAETTLLVDKFLNPNLKHHWSRDITCIIGDFVSSIGREARDRAWDKREELRKKHFAMYPELPADLDDYCDGNVFKHGYIFISTIDKSGKREAECSRCGRHFRVGRTARSGQQTECPRCGTAATYRGVWIKSDVTDKAKLCVADKVDGQLILRWIYITRTFAYPKFKRIYDFDTYAYNLYLNGGKIYFYKWHCDPYNYEYYWYCGRLGDQCTDRSYIYTDDLDMVFGERYYNVNLKKGLEGTFAQVSFNSLLNNLKNEPVAEYLFKLGMPILAANADDLMRGENCTHPSFTEVLGVSKQLYELYRSNDITVSEHRVIKAYGKWVSDGDFKEYRAFQIEPYDVDKVIEVLKTMSFSRFTNYFARQKKLTKRSMNYLLTSYRDYINMSVGLGVDLSHKSVRYPANIIEAHKQITARFNKVKHEAEDTLFAKKVKGLYQSLGFTGYENKGFCIVLPQSRTDLIKEGQTLNHCVGQNNYYKNHIAGTKMIFFVRKSKEVSKPYFTAEIDMTEYRILQLYGFGDCSAPKEVRRFVEGLVKMLKRSKTEIRMVS